MKQTKIKSKGIKPLVKARASEGPREWRLVLGAACLSGGIWTPATHSPKQWSPKEKWSIPASPSALQVMSCRQKCPDGLWDRFQLRIGISLCITGITSFNPPLKRDYRRKGILPLRSLNLPTHLWWSQLHRMNGRGSLQFASFPYPLASWRYILWVETMHKVAIGTQAWDNARGHHKRMTNSIHLQYFPTGLFLCIWQGLHLNKMQISDGRFVDICNKYKVSEPSILKIHKCILDLERKLIRWLYLY